MDKILKYLFASILLLTLASCSGDKKSNTGNTDGAVLVADSLATDWFLSLTDVHINSLNKGNVGFGKHNDTGDSLWIRTKAEIESTAKSKNARFMVYLGDLPHHDDASRQQNVSVMLKNLRDLKIDCPILYLPGNNDSPQGDYHSFSAVSSGDTSNVFNLDPSQTDPWPILNDTTVYSYVSNVDFNPEFGFYSADVNSGNAVLKIIALNTVIYCADGSHPYVSDDGVDQLQAATIQMRWFHNTLDQLGKDDRVLIMMHIPPGNDGFSNGPMWNLALTYDDGGEVLNIQEAFLKEVAAKKDNIVGVLTAHTHYDGLRRLYYPDSSGTKSMVAVGISTPVITIGHGNNPGFKFFKYRKDNFDLLDFETHYAEATQDYFDGYYHKRFSFEKHRNYTFQDSYLVADSTMPIYDVIFKMDSTQIIANMKKILMVNSPKSDANFNYGIALNVE